MSSSESEIEISTSSSTQLVDLKPETQQNVKSSLKGIKKKNRKIKTVIIKGTEHPSSSVPAQGEVVSISCRDDKGDYAGTFHLDTQGNTYTNKKFDKIAEKSKK